MVPGNFYRIDGGGQGAKSSGWANFSARRRRTPAPYSIYTSAIK